MAGGSGAVRRPYNPSDRMLGGYASRDGTVEFYTRVGVLLQPHFRVLDLGAGAGSWFAEDHNPLHRQLRDLRSKVAEYIGADVDPAVLTNPTTSSNLLIENGVLPLETASIDLIVADFVLEHVADPLGFQREVDRVLKPGGYFCARTPHVLNYVTLGARLVRNSRHAGVLRWLQPGRRAQDVFPTRYRLNTIGALRRAFLGWTDYSYLYAAEPMYYFGAKPVFDALSVLHKLAPASFTGTIFTFLQKPSSTAPGSAAGSS